jgi:hypothetical protein
MVVSKAGVGSSVYVPFYTVLTLQIEGVLTMSVGILLFFMIPRSPKLAFFLDDTQRELAAARIEEELRHRKNEDVDRIQIKRALLAPITWMCGLGFFLVNITVQSFSLFLVSPSSFLTNSSPRF